MLDFTVVNLETMEEKTVDGLTVAEVVKSELTKTDGQPVRVFSNNDCLLALCIAKTVARKVVQYMPNKTQQTIDDTFRRLNGQIVDYMKTQQPDNDSLTEYIVSHLQTVYMSDSDGDKNGLYTHSQDFFSVAMIGLLEGQTIYKKRFDIVNYAFLTVNRYIETLRTANEKEVLTAYDLESDEPINTELRRMTKGLTEKEEKDGKTVRQSELASAIVKTMSECTERQKTVVYYLSKGLSVRQTAKRLNVTGRAVQKHKEYIQKKLLHNDIVWKYVTSPEK